MPWPGTVSTDREFFMSAKKTHRAKAAVAAFSVFLAGAVHAQGIPVIDAAGLVQHIQGQITREVTSATTTQIHNEAVQTTSNTLSAIRPLESHTTDRHDSAARENSEKSEAARRAAAIVWDMAKNEIARQTASISSGQLGRIQGSSGVGNQPSTADAWLKQQELSGIYTRVQASVMGASHEGLNRIEDHIKSSEEQRREAAQAAASSVGANQASQANALLQSNAVQTQNAALLLMTQSRRDEIHQKELDEEMRKAANLAGHAQFVQDRAQAKSWFVPISSTRN